MGNLRAFVTLLIGEVKVHGCRVIQQPGQKAYVCGPQIKIGESYMPAVTLPKHMKAVIEQEVLNHPVVKSHIQ